MRKLNYLFFTGIFILLPHWSEAQVYHVDPNTGNAIARDAVTATDATASGIVLSNSSTVDISILLSDDKIKWDTTKIPKAATLSYPSKIKYVKIYTSANKFTYALLNSGYAYTIYWDSGSGKWDIK